MEIWVLWWSEAECGDYPPAGVFSSEEKAIEWLGKDGPVNQFVDGKGWNLEKFTVDSPRTPDHGCCWPEKETPLT